MSLVCRPRCSETDDAFIYSSWLRSFRLSHFAGVIPMHQYYAVYSDVVKDLLGREGVSITVAKETEHDVIVGWACTETGLDYVTRTEEGYRHHGELPVLHYLYVKQPFRKMGVARGLLLATRVNPDKTFLYTFRTSVAAKLARRFHKARFDPMVARNSKNKIHKERDENPHTPS